MTEEEKDLWPCSTSSNRTMKIYDSQTIKRDHCASCSRLYPDENENALNQAHYEQLCTRISVLERKNVSLKDSNDFLSQQNCTMEEQVNDLMKARESIEKQMIELRNFYQRKLDEKTSEVEMLCAKVDLITLKIQQNDEFQESVRHERSNIERRIEELQLKYSDIDSSLISRQTTEDRLHERLRSMERQMREEISRNAEMMCSYKTVEDEVLKLEKRLDDVNSELNSALKQLVKRDEDNIHVKQLLDFMGPKDNWNNGVYEDLLPGWDVSADEAIVDCYSIADELSDAGRPRNNITQNLGPRTSTVVRCRRDRRRRPHLHSRMRKRRSILAELERDHPGLMQSLPSWGINFPFDVHGTGSEASFDDSPELVDDDELIIKRKPDDDEASKSSLIDGYEIHQEIADDLNEIKSQNPGLFKRIFNTLRRLVLVDIFLWTKWYWLFCLRLPLRIVLRCLMIMQVPSIKR